MKGSDAKAVHAQISQFPAYGPCTQGEKSVVTPNTSRTILGFRRPKDKIQKMYLALSAARKFSVRLQHPTYMFASS